MTTFVSEDDVRSAAYQAGIKDPARLNAFIKIMNLRVYALAREMSGVILEDAFISPEPLYLCRSCGNMKIAEDFPESKRKNITKGVSCVKCQGKRLYKCTGWCGQHKPLDEFPEHKQANPHIPAKCSHCAKI